MGTLDAIIHAANILKEAGKIEEYKQILELLEERLKFVDQIARLKEENQSLKSKLKNKEEVVPGINCYRGADGTYYCMRCLDVDKELIRLKTRSGRSDIMDCPQCKNDFNTTNKSTVSVFNPRIDIYRNSSK